MSNSCRITVLNGFDSPATLILTHTFGSQPDEAAKWENVVSGATTSPPLTVHYATGPFSAFDYWHMEVQVSEGPNKGVWRTPGFKECYLTGDDQGATLQFSVSPGSFKLNMISSNCSDDLIQVA